MEFEDGRRATPASWSIAPRGCAWAKLTGIRFCSATVGGESFLFEPWLVTFVEERDRMRFVGVYRTDDESLDDAPAEH